ncbi:hypothetical protein HYDPIDRAFT_113521 [Hydnomerulius pinastri MD-312]|uniref:Methyltransferase domain-containing protein n=1 Tax=Hydnomerulius pinastri MD-312 TaxID=994086 RepID=A0A0C9WDG5_9AGAM|nr:hypothetical protein HYDPIDRAFT_113521 [Hydnomerulius pinastri MD-312]
MTPVDSQRPIGVPVGDAVFHSSSPSVTPLDPGLYSLTPEAAAFFKAATGIQDDEELKTHILSVQAKAYNVAPYPCISGFGFLRIGITKNPVYQNILKLGRERPGAILLDLGCCLSVDSRKAAADGFPASNIIASDLKGEFFQLSHVLFKTSEDTYPAHFVLGDAFDPAILSVVSPFQESPSSRQDLSGLASLNPLHGHCSAINASAFFHLFGEKRQLHMARALAGLLSPEPGSLICGAHVGAPEKGVVSGWVVGRHFSLFCHSPESWADMWNGVVFEKGQVKVEAEIHERDFLGIRDRMMIWSVLRL